MGRGTANGPGLRAAAVGGLAGASATTLLIGLVHTFAPAVPFLPESIAQSLVRAAPGGFATYFIERLGHWAIRLALAGTFAGFLLGGALVGLLVPFLPQRLSPHPFGGGVVGLTPPLIASVATLSSHP